VVAAVSSGGLARPKLLLGSELRPADRCMARLNINELQRVGSREPPGIEPLSQQSGYLSHDLRI